MTRIIKKLIFSIFSDSKLSARRGQTGVALLALFCFIALPTYAKAACGRYGTPIVKASIKLPPMAAAGHDFPGPSDATIVGLWHVIYTQNDQTPFNNTFDTWHSDGTEFESAFLAPAGGDVCVGAWRSTGYRTVKLHHIGWLFNPSTPTATATNTFTLDELITVAQDGKTYSGTFTFKVWNLDGTPTPVEEQGTIAATRITPDSE
ncbi:MAG: hypothetical protein WBY53_01345 [Acidobacteriaceae bacterium]